MAWNDLGGLLWLLAIGALFYLMMRKGGCGMGSGHVHGGGHPHEVGEASGSTGHAGHEAHEHEPARDPVCGMQVDPERAAGTRTSAGGTFYLCSQVCLEKFDHDPEAYARHAVEDKGREHAHRHGGC